MASIPQTMRVVMDTDAMTLMLQPILDEVNSLRRRVQILEDGAVDDGK